MEPLLKKHLDRRYYARTEIGCHVSYRLFNQEELKDAMLVDISETGALIGTHEELDLDTHIYMTIEPAEADEQPIQLLAETIRQANKIEGYEYCYGCMILDVFY